MGKYSVSCHRIGRKDKNEIRIGWVIWRIKYRR